MNDVFSSLESYKTKFNQGLIELAQDNSLGTFILAMANATFDERIYSEVKHVLSDNFLQLKEKYNSAFSQGKRINEVDEDLLVFLKMLCVGFEELKTTEFRTESGWELQFNHVRGFRPNRISQQKIESLHLDFSVSGFNFNKPFMAKERLWEGELNNSEFSLYYNKYPFAHYHTLLVPEREKQHPQFLENKQHLMMWQLLESIGHNIPGIGVGYNSRGAYSSVNHLHFQLFIRENALPVTAEKWQHNGGKEAYPGNCVVFKNSKESGQFIEELHQTNTAYNLVYFPGYVYCFPRKMQGSYSHAEWTPGFSWYELAGGLLTASRDSYLALNKNDIEAEFKLLRLNSD